MNILILERHGDIIDRCRRDFSTSDINFNAVTNYTLLSAQEIQSYDFILIEFTRLKKCVDLLRYLCNNHYITKVILIFRADTSYPPELKEIGYLTFPFHPTELLIKIVSIFRKNDNK